MPSPLESEQVVAARKALGRQLAALRQASGYTQAQLASMVGYTRSTLGNVETGRQNVPRTFWELCRDELGAPELVTGYEQVEAMAATAKRAIGAQAEADREIRVRTWHRQVGSLASEAGPARSLLQMQWPGVRQSAPSSGHGVDWYLEFPPGRLLDNSGHMAIQVHRLAKTRDGTILIPARDPRLRQLAATTQRAMIIGVDEQAESLKLRAVDVRYVRSELKRASGAMPAISVPREYELDDLSFAIIWAVTLLDDALLADDYALDERRRELNGYEKLPQSAVGRETAEDLNAASRLWLGSAFCSRHILRNLDQASGRPVFWTQEQTGEEACMWLLFRHKQDYLRRISSRGDDASTQRLARGFCIPETVALASPRWERILFFLAVALMESLGIRVLICAEPEYAEADGFVLLPGNRVIIATWIHADGIWHVGVSSRPALLREFGEVSGHAGAHSVTDAPSPGHRLKALASYLGLDWTWLGDRCLQLGRVGCGGLVRPRSRLLSIDGVDAALCFAGNASREEASCGTLG